MSGVKSDCRDALDPPCAEGIPGAERRGGWQGFTLLEIMIALAISGIVVACLFAVYNQTLETGEQIKAQAGLEQSARMIFSQLHRDLEGLYYRPSQNASSPGPYSFRGGEQSGMSRQEPRKGSPLLRFGSTTALDFREESFPEKRLFRVRYILREAGPEGEGPNILIRSQLAFPEIREEPSRLALSNQVSDFSLTFIDSSGREQSSWDSLARLEQEDKPPLPRRIFLELTLQSKDGAKRTYEMQFALSGNGEDENG
ncbi:MAG: prepilin-type N-terminal cleavage/methylation domain-containing protein [Desulfohalobiaceae bacterium]|nr:prepilin-type N-terminal cleavage/methylation domain-containing protein [Desulfohalobiaceae bacterium]